MMPQPVQVLFLYLCNLQEMIFQTVVMVTYQIQIPDSKAEAFLRIIASLQSVGVVKSFTAYENLTQPGEPMEEDYLLSILEASERQANEGMVVPDHQIASFLKLWKQGQSA